MDLAISLPLPGVDLAETPALVAEAARWGYRAAWASEVAGPDFASLLGAVAAGVEAPLDLGVAVVPVQTRSPWLLAATAASLAQLARGRFTLGLGTSSEVIVEQWSGAPFERPLAQLRETTEVVRRMLGGERVSHAGQFVRTSGYRLFAPPPQPVPIVLGALNPRSLRQAGEVGDGVCLNQLGPEHLPAVLAEVRAGATDAGGELGEEFAVIARLFCWVTDDLAGARDVVRRTFAPYVATSVYNRFYRWLGFEEEAEAVLAAFARGDRAGAAAAMSDSLVDTVTSVGNAEHVATRVAAFAEAGVTVGVIAPVGPGRSEATRTLKAVASALT